MCIGIELNAQKQANIWYFGYGAGIDFNSGSPVAITDGKLSTDEGCASVADDSGAILFYTDGVKVYNKNHTLMPNGSGLLGNFSSTQSSIVVPLPGSKTIYYIFTVDFLGNRNGLQYSIVDITKDGGNGDVTIKNVKLYDPACEKITAVLHKNEKDFWIISHKFKSDEFVAYQLTGTGLNTTPIITAVGEVHGGLVENTRGYMKVSPDGSTLALACDYCNFIEILDFNNATGAITNPRKLAFTKPYGIEFSPNNRYLYVSSWASPGYIVQLDISKSTAAAIKSSEVQIASINNVYSLNALQLGPDGKIYIATYKNYLNAITDPNELGVSCNYITNYVDLNGKQSAFGLPTYIQSFFNLPLITYKNICFKDSTKFILSHDKVDSISWDFGDPSSGNKNTSKSLKAFHIYSDSGTFIVRTIVYFGAAKDTAFTNVKIVKPNFSLGNDTTLCSGGTLLLRVNNNALNTIWHDGSKLKTFNVTQKGLYWAEVKSSTCLYRDSILVDYITLPKLDLGNDTAICDNSSYTLQANIGAGQYIWQNGSTNNQLKITNAGKYKLIYTEKNCSIKDSINIQIRKSPAVYLGKDTAFCSGQKIDIQINKSNSNLLWSDNSKAASISLSKEGLYWIEIDSIGCKTRDSITIQIIPAPKIDLGNGFTICDGDSLVLNYVGLADTYLWHDGSTSASIKIKDSTLVKIYAKTGLCSTSDSALAVFIDCNCFVFIPNAFTPQEDFLNDVFGPQISCPHTDFKFIVMNRWGEIVYESNDVNLKWDGTSNNAIVEQGLYVYSIQFTYFVNKKQMKYNGTIQVLR